MAYASVASLMRTMGSVLASKSPMKSLISDHREEFLALHEKVSFLEVFLKNFEKDNNSGKLTDLEAQIKELASVVEHTIQLRLTEILTTNDEMQKEKIYERLWDSLKQVAEEFDRVQKESTKFQDKGKQAPKEFLVQDSSSEKHTPYVENNMVGRDDQRKRMLTELTCYGSSSGELKVIPIVGMGGIGKTTLAKDVYNDASIRLHFDVHSWATVSQQHDVKEILLSLLRCTKGDKFYMDSEAELADMLQKSLKGKRYLIVLDDMWKSEAWDAVRLCFPSENNGSRILLTTRNTEVACSAGTGSLSLQMDLMGPDESWNLFESIVFANEALPSEFKTIGKKIAEKCHGLPLTIAVVAGLLKSKRTIEHWENVAKDVKSITNDPDKQCLDVLGLSYNHLTSDLKACLLYFGVFPEDSEISRKRLVRLWMGEGFLKLENDLEGEAEKCLQELVDRCLVLVSKKSLDETKIRSCKVHDLIYDLCLREIKKGNVFIMNDIVFENSDAKKAQSHDVVFNCEPNHVPSECQSLSRMQPFKRWTGDKNSDRALITPGHHQLTDDDNTNLLERTRSIFFSDRRCSTFILKSELIHFKLLKILDLSHMWIDSVPIQILSLIWLRYLSLYCHQDLGTPPEIWRLQNLQTFIVKGSWSHRSVMTFPEQIWGLMQLRHLELHRFYLPNLPSGSVDKGRHLDFSNIQTISYLSARCCTKEVILGIQNVKKLGVLGDDHDYESSGFQNNLVHLKQLETLSLRYFYNLTIPSAEAFPATLKKLKLERTSLSWSYLDIIAELPNLEVLKLMCDACRDKEWHPNVRGFTRLKFLLIEHNSIKYWKATNDNFPVLELLVLRNCFFLKELPIEFADVHTLQLIELSWCPPELGESVALIQQEQEDLGNKPVDVRISDPYNYQVYDSGDDDDDNEDFTATAAEDDDNEDS